MECGERPAFGWTSAWISSWTTTSPANRSRKAGRDVAGVMSRKGVTRSQSAATVTAATKPIGSARRFSIQGDGGWRSGLHGAAGTKSGELGMVPRWKRMCSGLVWPPNVPVYRRRANDVCLSTETRSRHCQQRVGWADSNANSTHHKQNLNGPHRQQSTQGDRAKGSQQRRPMEQREPRAMAAIHHNHSAGETHPGSYHHDQHPQDRSCTPIILESTCRIILTSAHIPNT